MPQIAEVGESVFIGNADACANGAMQLGGAKVHLYSRLPCPACEAVFWDESLPPSRRVMSAVRASAQSTGPLFIHCDSGLRCAPLMALVALVTRGISIERAQQSIRAAMIAEYEHPRDPHWSEADLEAVVGFLRRPAKRVATGGGDQIRSLETRLKIPGYLTSCGLDGEGVEVGVGSGWYSYHILKESQLTRLYSVDPWSRPRGSGAVSLSAEWQYVETVRNLAPFGLRSVVLRMTSAEAARLFAPQSLDFVYIDANHDYRWVRSDLSLWMPKVRPGGILAGHDYCDVAEGVRQAVDEFADWNRLPLNLTTVDEMTDGGTVQSWLLQIQQELRIPESWIQ